MSLRKLDSSISPAQVASPVCLSITASSARLIGLGSFYAPAMQSPVLFKRLVIGLSTEPAIPNNDLVYSSTDFPCDLRH
eukprot:2034118-Rhodomonas_salina.1